MSDLAERLQDPQRLAALRRLLLLDTAATESLDRLARLAARTLHTPMALMTLVDGDRQYFKAAFGLPAPLDDVRETPLTYSICQYAVVMGAPLVVCDARVEHWLDDNPAVTELGVMAYAGVPLVTAAGHAGGTRWVLARTAREWTRED